MNVDGVHFIPISAERVTQAFTDAARMVERDADMIPDAAAMLAQMTTNDTGTVGSIVDYLIEWAQKVTKEERAALRKRGIKAAREARRESEWRGFTPRPDHLELEAEISAEAHKAFVRAEGRARHEATRDGDRPMIADGLLDYAALAARPPLRPLIEGVLNVDTVAMLYAPPATFKTFLALWWAACIALGRPWAGRAVEQGPVLYVAAEGVAGIQKRVAALAWLLNRGKPIPDLFIYPAPVNLTSDGEVEEIAALVADRGFRFVIFDTLVKVAGGAEENDNTAMTRVTNAAERIKRAGDGETTVALVHHSGKSGDYRGASALEGNVDTMLKLDGEAGMLTLSAVKQKDGEGGEIIRLRAKPVPEHETLVLEPIGPGEGQPSGMQAARIEEALAHFTRAYGATGVTRSEYARNLVEWGVAGGQSTAQTYIGDLISSGRLARSNRGRSTYLELAPERHTFSLTSDTHQK